MRVERAFAFVDLCGFTAFTERHGDEKVVVVLAALRTALRESAARRGVRVVKWLGDGAMLSSTMPDAICALVVELDHHMRGAMPSLALKAGMSTGPVIMFEGDDYIGGAVNLAARLCDAAGAHELLATPALAARVPLWVVAEPADPLALPGFEARIDPWRLSLREPMPGEAVVACASCGLPIPASTARPGPDDTLVCSRACAGVDVGDEFVAR